MTVAFKKPSAVLGAALLLSAFGISLFFEGYRDIHYAPAALCLLAFGCVAVLPAFWRGLETPSAPAPLILFALWIYVTMSLSWSSVPFASLVTYLVFIALPLPFFAILISTERETWIRILGAAFVAMLAAAALWAVIQLAFFSGIYGDRAHHPLPNPNNLAGLLNLGLLPALAWFMCAREKDWQLAASLALTIMLFAGLVATESRGGMIAAGLTAVPLIFWLRKNPPVLWQRLLILLVPAVIIFFLISGINDMRFAARLTGLGVIGADEPAMARLAIWANAWQMFKDHFWLGTGLGTFYLYYPSYREPGADNSLGNWAHMDPLQYGAEMGVLAPLLLYGLAFAVLVRTMRALKTAEGTDRAIIAGTFCALAAVFIHTHVTFNLYIMPVLLCAGVWLAAWYHHTARAIGAGYKTIPIERWQKPFMAGTVVSIATLIGVMAVTSATGQHHLLRAHELIKQGKPEQFSEEIEKAEKWAPRSFIDPEVQLAAFYIDLLGPNAAALFTAEEQQSLFDQTETLLNIAAQMNPPWAEVDYQRGLLYARANPALAPGTREQALAAFETAIRKDPQHFRAREELAALYIQRGQVEKAYTLLQESLRYPHPHDVELSHFKIMDSIRDLVTVKRDYERQKETP